MARAKTKRHRREYDRQQVPTNIKREREGK